MPRPKQTPLTPEQRSSNARIAAHTRLAKMSPEERATMAAAARAAQIRKMEDEVDPDRVLSEKDRADRVSHLIKAQMERLRLKKSRAQLLAQEQQAALEALAAEAAGE